MMVASVKWLAICIVICIGCLALILVRSADAHPHQEKQFMNSNNNEKDSKPIQSLRVQRQEEMIESNNDCDKEEDIIISEFSRRKAQGTVNINDDNKLADDVIILSFETYDRDGTLIIHEFYLEQTLSVFGNGATIEILGGDSKQQSNNNGKGKGKPVTSQSKSYVTRSMMPDGSNNTEWGLFNIRLDEKNPSNYIIHGIFTTDSKSKVMKLDYIRNGDKDKTTITKQSSSSSSIPNTANARSGHMVYEVDLEYIDNYNSDQGWKCGNDNDGDHDDHGANEEPDDEGMKYRNQQENGNQTDDGSPSTGIDKYIKFYPGCYTGDDTPRQFDIGIVVDYGYFKAVGSNINALEYEIEQMVSYTRAVYMMQLNIIPVVQNLVVSTSATETFPLNMSPDDGTCAPDIVYALREFANWNAINNDNIADRERGHWHLLTSCWKAGEKVGYSEISSLCDAKRNVAISSRISSTDTWLIFAHEMGHAFGATHSIGAGGLMDYNNPYYKGIIQFDAGKRNEMCKEIKSVVGTCKHFSLITKGSVCGNGVIEKGEMCECLRIGSISCDKCVNCDLTDSKVKCSTKDFQMRTTDDDFSVEKIIVDENKLSSSECCSPDGVMYTPMTNCNNGADVCIKGKCQGFCSLYNFKSCKSINQGCSQPCIYADKCSAKLITQDGHKISWIPDGTQCGNNAQCKSGLCVVLAPTTMQPTTAKPTRAPTIKPTPVPTIKRGPTRKPTSEAPTTATPTDVPTTSIPTQVPITRKPTKFPTTKSPVTPKPTRNPTSRNSGTSMPTTTPSSSPIRTKPTKKPTKSPINKPSTQNPTSKSPSLSPTSMPTSMPSDPTSSPSSNPITNSPIDAPTAKAPTIRPTKPIPTTKQPTLKPSKVPTRNPTTKAPVLKPGMTLSPTISPTSNPTTNPTKKPSTKPTKRPTKVPTRRPSKLPSISPTLSPTNKPKRN